MTTAPGHRATAAIAALLALGAALVAPPASAAAPPATLDAQLRLGSAGGDATLVFPFHLEQDATVYAKLQPTPWNAVLPGGAPNGTVSQDRSTGLAGWWVRLELQPDGGTVVPLGHFADGGASAPVAMQAGRHELRATLHAPSDAGPVGMAYRVDIALSQRGEGQGTDPSWSLAAQVRVVETAGADPASAAPAVLLAALLLAVLGAGMAVLRRRRREPGPWL